MPESYEERRRRGRALRKQVPRSAMADGATPPPRDPITILEAQAATRAPDLIPIRHARMAESPFAFFRGGAAIMAADLADTATTGLRVQACGDAHIANFGTFATPERNVVFDINDFDETLPGPWEWDVKRLCASLQVVAVGHGFADDVCRRVVMASAREYRQRMRVFAGMRTLDLWYERIDVDDVIAHFPAAYRPIVERDVRKAERKNRFRAVAKLTRELDGAPRLTEDPPFQVHVSGTDSSMDEVAPMVESYRSTLSDSRRELFDRFEVADVARRVVGVGSVGTRCWVVLLVGRDHPDGDRLILQVKEALPSVLEPYVGESSLGHRGRRVVAGQRITQAASDLFLGWCEAATTGREYYVRQLWDVKGQGDLLQMDEGALARYGALCAWALARAHARTGDAVPIAGYLGGSDRFDRALADYSAAYAAVNEADHQALLDAIASGRVEAAARAR